MAVLVIFSVFILVFVGGSDATWCVCRNDVSDSALQKTLDYACGAGADCSTVLQNGACYQPNTVRSHCSYAANSYFQKKGQTSGSCDFSGTATISTTDPSYNSCSYPSTSSGAGTSTNTPSTSTTNPTSGTSTSTTPNTFNNSPTNGVLGGLGPSGTGITTDGSDGGFLPKPGAGSLLTAIIFSGLVLFREGLIET